MGGGRAGHNGTEEARAGVPGGKSPAGSRISSSSQPSPPPPDHSLHTRTLWLHSPQPQGEMTILDCFSRPTYS